ncbi:IS30 family transposase [Micrococcus luteus]
MIGPPRVPRERVRQFWKARLAGATIEQAATAVGVSASAGRRWVVESGGMIPCLDEPGGRYLSLAEREEIALGWAAGLSRAEIARRLGRHRATIGRELARNRIVRHPRPHERALQRRAEQELAPQERPQHVRLRYRATTAQGKAEERARRPKPRRLSTCPELAATVHDWLTDKQWSPEQISQTLRRTFPDRPEMRVSHETIYQGIYQGLYVQGRGELRRELATCLRTGRALRRPNRLPDARRARNDTRIRDKVMISERPAEVADRAVPGHWEGDLILGTANGSAIGTLVERTTRFVMLLHLPDGHGADQVRDAMIASMRVLPALLRRSLTWDQGIELARHKDITFALDLPVYFCDPHSPWQRGSNENTNGLLRQYFPKGTDLSVHTHADLDRVADKLNSRPRKTLGWDTPGEWMARLLSRPVTTGVAPTP